MQQNPEQNKNFLLYANSSVADVLKKLESSEKGLSQQQVEKRFAQYGPNELEKTTVTWFDVLKNQILNPFILIFIIIAGIYFFTQEYTECIILIIIMVANTAIGFYQEYQSNRAMELLKSYLQSNVVVHRGDKDDTVETNQLVPGDIYQTECG